MLPCQKGNFLNPAKKEIFKIAIKYVDTVQKMYIWGNKMVVHELF